MRPKNFKGGKCVKMKLQKCDEVARTYDAVQAAYAAILDLDDNIESIKCNVVLDDIALHKFDSFEDLYDSLPLLQCGYTENDILTASPNDMDVYYSKEKQKEYGVIGIEIELYH